MAMMLRRLLPVRATRRRIATATVDAGPGGLRRVPAAVLLLARLTFSVTFAGGLVVPRGGTMSVVAAGVAGAGFRARVRLTIAGLARLVVAAVIPVRPAATVALAIGAGLGAPVMTM